MTTQTGVGGKVREGNVVSDKMQKTIVVAIEANFRHRLYKKTVRRVRRFMVHDETEEAKLGDRVRIVEASPISRRKRWRLLEVLTRADLPEVAPESIDLELLGEVKAEEPEVDEVAAAPAPAEGDSADAVPEEAVSSPEAEAVVPDEVDAAEEVPEIEEAAPAVTDESSAVDEVAPEQAEQPAEPKPTEDDVPPAEDEETTEEAAPEDETEGKPS